METDAIRILRDIIEGDDATMTRAIEEGRALLARPQPTVAASGADAVDQIVAHVAARHGCLPADLLGSDRRSRSSRPRQIALYLCRELLGMPYTQLAQRFNRCDHGTVCYGVKRIRDWADTDPVFRGQLKMLQVELRGVAP